VFDEDLDAFFEDHGKPCLIGLNQFVGILDQADADLSFGQSAVKSRNYGLLVKTSVANGLAIKHETVIDIDSIGYVVRAADLLDDGAFTQLTLSKL
jgi:hypothetical protein